MTPSEESQRVFELFNRYVSTGDGKLIESVTVDQLSLALCQYVGDVDKILPVYLAMKNKKESLLEDVRTRRDSREKWLDRGIGFFGGVAATVLAAYLLRMFRIN